MTPIINSYFNKHTISSELIHLCLIHPYASVTKVMCHHQTLTGLPKHFPKKINIPPCTICYTANMISFPKITTLDRTKIQPEELLHMDFALYNATSAQGFNSMLTVVCAKTITTWVFTTESKIPPFRIIHFILTTLNNEQNKCKRVRVDEDGALKNSKYATKLLVDEFSISMETTGGDAS